MGYKILCMHDAFTHDHAACTGTKANLAGAAETANKMGSFFLRVVTASGHSIPSLARIILSRHLQYPFARLGAIRLRSIDGPPLCT